MTDPPSAERRPQTASPGLSDTDAIAALIIMSSLVMVLWNLQDSSIENANTGSRYATVESIVDYGTYAIDHSIFHKTVDRVMMDGRTYSSKPPLLPTYAAGVYWVQQKLTGKTARDNEGAVVWMGSLMSGWLFHLIFMVYFYRLSKRLFVKPLAILGSLACAGFAYLGVGYASTLNNHSIAASVATAGFYYAVRARRDENGGLSSWLLSGLWLGFLPALDVPAAAITGVIGLYLFLTDKRKALMYFAPALLPGVCAHLMLTYVSSGSLIPIYLRRDLYDYAGSYWKKEIGIDALHEPKHIYTWNVLLGHHGLFSMSPIFVFSAYELYRTLRSKLGLYAEALVGSAASLVLIVFYVFYSRNYGGWCVGMRWFIPFMPFLLLFVGAWLERVELRKLNLILFVAAFGVSEFNAQDALDDPFQYSMWHNFIGRRPNRNRVGKTVNLGQAAADKKQKAEKAAKKERRRSKSSRHPEVAK